MDTNELMEMASIKAIKELDWESIEFLLKPTNMGELLLRIDFEGFKGKVYEAFVDDSPTAMPHRFRGQYWPAWSLAFKKEEFYRKCKALHEEKIGELK